MTTRTPWPTNAGAYLKALTGAGPLAGVVVVGMGDYVTPEVALAALVAGLGHLAVLLAGRPWLKVALSWLSTLLGAVALAAVSYEGAGGLTWAGIAQWDGSDLRMLGLLVLASLAHTLVPNLPARYHDVVGEVLGVTDADAPAEVLGTADIPDPLLDPQHGDPVDFATESTVLAALTPEQVAEHAGERAAVPAPSPSLDDALVARGYTL